MVRGKAPLQRDDMKLAEWLGENVRLQDYDGYLGFPDSDKAYHRRT